MPVMRPELTPLPPKMVAAGLPVDERGYPVPWFVWWDETGRPDHRIADRAKRVVAIREKRCWVCGGRMGKHLAFVIGPMCGITRTSSDPPSHLECAMWSIANCPFMARPHMVRREAGVPEAAESPGYLIPRNPGVMLLWLTQDYSLFRDGEGGDVLLRVGDPVSVTFWREGRPAEGAEVEESIQTGLPLLEARVETEAERADLAGAVAKLRAMLP